MEINSRVTFDSQIHHGAPVISGTRVPVSVILGSMAGEMSCEAVEFEYEVSDEDVSAALQYAADLVSETTVMALAA